jgi:hypothetical protein
MYKDTGYHKFCWINANNKTANCGDKYDNIQTSCKRSKVFLAEDSQGINSKQSNSPSSTYTNIMASGFRDPTIDYNYFRASNTK